MLSCICFKSLVLLVVFCAFLSNTSSPEFIPLFCTYIYTNKDNYGMLLVFLVELAQHYNVVRLDFNLLMFFFSVQQFFVARFFLFSTLTLSLVLRSIFLACNNRTSELRERERERKADSLIVQTHIHIYTELCKRE